jgi:NlpC/P60 family
MPRVRRSEYSFAANRFARACCWTFALCAGSITASAQGTPERQQAAPAMRLVTPEEGRQIAAIAVEEDGPIRGRQDCSHLVNQIYMNAGYEYPYASSFELYAGNGKFRRIRHPQPGDLIAWPGHVGIVLDARQHTFYSLVRSGLQAEDYLGPYWRSRGRPRFFRYLVTTGTVVQTAEAVPAPRPRARKSAPVSSATGGEEVIEAEGASHPIAAKEASERTPLLASPSEPLRKDTAESIPSSIVISVKGARPSAEEVADGISDLSNAAANVLRTSEPLKVPTPVVIFDALKVERVETKRDKGWVYLRIQSHVRIGNEGANFKQRNEKVRWELRREENGWVALAPAERTFVAHDAAVSVLAAQLAEMSQSEAVAQHDEAAIAQEARIVSLLSALFTK